MFKNINSFSFILYTVVIIAIFSWVLVLDKKSNSPPKIFENRRSLEEIMQNTEYKYDNITSNFDTEFKSSIQPIEEKHGN